MSIWRSNIWNTPHDDSASSQSLERGLAILGAFTPDRPALGISELAQRLHLTCNTTHRYVGTRARLGYLDQAEVAAGGRTASSRGRAQGVD
jgi:IclR helix-turn-helix domain